MKGDIPLFIFLYFPLFFSLLVLSCCLKFFFFAET